MQRTNSILAQIVAGANMPAAHRRAMEEAAEQLKAAGVEVQVAQEHQLDQLRAMSRKLQQDSTDTLMAIMAERLTQRDRAAPGDAHAFSRIGGAHVPAPVIAGSRAERRAAARRQAKRERKVVTA